MTANDTAAAAYCLIHRCSTLQPPLPSAIVIADASTTLTTAVALRQKILWFCQTALVSLKWKI
jgi:hypothetical protein